MASFLAKVLLGWMDEAEAMSTLLGESAADPPLTEADARALWNEYRRRVAALPPRACAPPARLKSRTPHERYEESWCIQEHRKQPQFIGVVKLDDPGKLVMHQLLIAVPESEKYLADMQDPRRQVRVCLGRGLEFDGLIPKAERRGHCLVKPMPHFEFSVPLANNDDFDVEEGYRAIAVKEFDGRMMLAAGAHRSHASMYRTSPEEMVRPLFAVLESDVVDGFFSEGTKAPAPFKRDLVRGPRPPLLADFFDANLCIQIPQRKRRMELWVDLETRQWSREWKDAE
jgi:hypothetical protein